MIEEVWMTATGELVVLSWKDDNWVECQLNEMVRAVVFRFGGECLGEL